MNYTASQYTGARAATFTATMDGASVAMQVGSESVLQAAVVHLGLRGERGIQGEAGAAMTGGAGIVVVGTEIRLSIGTLPQT